MAEPSGFQPATIPTEERGLAVATHLSGLAGYVIPFGGVIVPIVIWIVKSDSRIISSIAKQALLLNLIVFCVALSLLLLALTVILIPVSIAGWIVILAAALVLPIVGAIKASEGRYYRYPVIGIEP